MVLPLGLAAAVSPVMVSEQAVIVGGPRGRRTGALYAVGTLVVLVGVTLGGWLLGRSLKLPSFPDLNATTDLVVGLALVAAAVLVARYRPRHPKTATPHTHGPMSARAALGFGGASMATNVTTLTLVLVAVKDVAAAGQPAALSMAVLGLLVILGAASAWVPVALAFLPGQSITVMTKISRAVSAHSRQIAVAVLLLAGAYLVIRGVVHFVDL